MSIRHFCTLFFRPLLLICIIIVFASCRIKQNCVYNHSIAKSNVQLFIELPQSNTVFENISTLIYDVFTEHFERLGYQLMTSGTDGYTLRIIIKSLEPTYKYISPDIVLFHATLRLELLAQLLNYKKKIVAQKSFAFTTLASKPQNPILNSDFLNFEYTRLLKKAAPKIEQYFRPFSLRSAD